MPPLNRVGRYEILNRLGEGGMGVVYLATDPLLDRTVAIKVLSTGSDDSDHWTELKERFAREARSAASLRHHHIVTIYDVGEDQGRPFIAMEYLDGETLAEMIRRRAPVTIERKLQIAIELCAGLGFAHRNDIIHRDIKPANLMITAEGGLKILDFGLARLSAALSNAGLTRAGALMGTPYYMSPEQIEGKPLDQRSDIFAVGVVLYELLSYRRPFEGDGPHVVLHHILHGAPERLAEIMPGIDPDLDRVVHRAMERDRDQRFGTLAQVATELERVRERAASASADTIVPPQLPHKTRGTSGRLRSGGDGAGSGGGAAIPNLDVIAQRRASQIEGHLSRARERLAEGDHLGVIAACEEVVLIDPTEHRALDMLQSAHRAIEDRQVQGWLDDAGTKLAAGALTDAEQLVAQSLQLRPNLASAQRLQRDIRDRRREIERAAERARALRSALDRARASLESGAFDAAVRSAGEALAYDSTSADAEAIRQQAMSAIEERQRRLAHEQLVNAIVAQARLDAEAEDYESALRRLKEVSPSHPLVDDVIKDVVAAQREWEQRRDDEARRQREIEDEQRRQEEARRARQREEARLRLERERAEAEAADQRQRDVDRLLAQATECAERDPAAALRLAESVLALVPSDPRAQRLMARVQESIDAQRRVEIEPDPSLYRQSDHAGAEVPAAEPWTVLVDRDAQTEEVPSPGPIAAAGHRRPWHKRPALVGLIAASAVLATLFGGWLGQRRDGPPPPPPPPPPVDRLAAIVAQATQQHRAGDVTGAIAAALKGLEMQPNDGRLVDLLGAIRKDAEAAAATARQQAVSSGAERSPDFQAADQRHTQATALVNQTDTNQAVVQYGEAIRLYDRARSSLMSEQQLLQLARQALASQQEGQAISYAEQVLARSPSNGDARRMLETIRKNAADKASTARTAALRVGAKAQPQFDDGESKFNEATALGSRETATQVRLFALAAGLFDAARTAMLAAAADARKSEAELRGRAEKLRQSAQSALTAGDLDLASREVDESIKLFDTPEARKIKSDIDAARTRETDERALAALAARRQRVQDILDEVRRQQPPSDRAIQTLEQTRDAAREFPDLAKLLETELGRVKTVLAGTGGGTSSGSGTNNATGGGATGSGGKPPAAKSALELDREEILALMDAYRQAYESRSADAIIAVAPYLKRDRQVLVEVMQNATSYSMTLQAKSPPAVRQSGDRATVEFKKVITVRGLTPADGKTSEGTMEFRKVNGRWAIFSEIPKR